jgi:hypothetical protein
LKAKKEKHSNRPPDDQEFNDDKLNKRKKAKPSSVSEVYSRIDPYIEEEDKEIKRLEKLLGIGNGVTKEKAAMKLNKEYEMFEVYLSSN